MDFLTSGALFAPYICQQNARDLTRIRALLRALGNPQETLRCVHIAGTDGKGSTAAMLDAVFRAAGYRTGLYTSPALRQFNERMRVDGVCIPDGALRRITARVGAAVECLPEKPNEFELVTAIGLCWFAAQSCQVVVLETGLGGRLDATNVIASPLAAVITPIGMDHMALLGDTLEKIAAEKAGILKPGCPAVLAPQPPEAQAVLCRACAAVGVEPVLAGTAARLYQRLTGQHIRYGAWNDLELPLLGDYQLQNAATVLETVQVLRAGGWQLPDRAVAAGFKTVHWPARLEVLRQSPPVLLDGAHNAHGAAALERSLTALFGQEKLTLVAGVLADKDYRAILGGLAGHAKRLYLVPPPSPRALPARDAERAARLVFPAAVGFDTVEAGLAAAMEAQQTDGAPVVCFGSLYMAGTVLDWFEAGHGG